MRAFIAIELPETAKRALAGLVDRLRPIGVRASWVKPEALHLTLRFLGDIDDATAERIRAALREGYADAAAFPLHIKGVGAFPNLRRPNVVWAGVELSEALAAAQAVAERAAQAAGLDPERKAFRPHLTVARIKDPAAGAALAAPIEAEGDFDIEPFLAGGVTLFSSRLTSQGPIHSRIEEYPFR